MSKEPYNPFQDAGSPLASGSQMDDLLVTLKAIINRYGDSNGELMILKEDLMYVDPLEGIQVDEFFDEEFGASYVVLSLTHVEPPVDQLDPNDERSMIYKIGYGCGGMLWVVVILSVLYLIFHIISWIVAGATS